jgi:hypothetical protein
MAEDMATAIADLAGLSVAAGEAQGTPLPEVAGGPDVSWSVEALELLELAESRLRRGDWQGFGEALAELRTVLERGTGG